MAALVGDAIIAGRQMIPDMPQVLPPPTIQTLAPGAGGTISPATYFIVVTAVNQWGETAPSNELSIAITAGQSIIVNWVNNVVSPPAFTSYRIYLGLASGRQNIFLPVTMLPPTTITDAAAGFQPGAPPQLNRAFNPDSDGALVGAFAVFQWLNDGLKIISRETGGLLDYAGVPSALGQPLYTIPGEWNEITSIWYDGYWLTGGDRGQFFRRNSITSQILSAATISVVNNTNIMELYPQPARTGATTTLGVAMGASDNSATLVSAAGFVLPFGFFQVDSEIMAYGAIAGNKLTGLIRGLGGSVAAAHNPSAPVSELNVFWSGKRQLSPSYAPGTSSSTLPIPTGWEVLLAQYIGGRAKVIEHDLQSMSALVEDMRKSIKIWASTIKPIARRRQVGGLSGPAVLYPDIAGGIILP